ncbi:MAG TPA: 6,7-dimethyl-8-ribityllumazine synthase [Acidobacteriota bacterium]|jgi:6,7-dimethyl-8-ribityllumazine synthase|nr:6,7-dimethyl-8-ribityllumazine synthase [Acidobacteriota bacterium]HNT16666.1 6,7-dimethyl-8-ribityllumazine synthase [Acidobacteriota bacterium]HPA26271.1 6,7-dimethyl-8-ribityllumazine synthase [Acidobacteriota bacterium]HQO19545.1 6,7-dimethyl-8-ribityllumazine synthase [Acidobacteriota bacterium]HQQ46279.1 6,7-dimethyl-8-ribityllumazine synthase [Acidobacteriota bacterium]
MKTLEGKLLAKDLSFGIVVSRFNDFFSKKLLDGALDALKRHGADEAKITVAWVPGSFELPLVARKLAKSKKFNAVIALGVLIQGATPHFDYIASETAKGIALASFETDCPISFGVVTAESIEQAVERAGSKSGNKGFHAAQTAIEMANLYKVL